MMTSYMHWYQHIYRHSEHLVLTIPENFFCLGVAMRDGATCINHQHAIWGRAYDTAIPSLGVFQCLLLFFFILSFFKRRLFAHEQFQAESYYWKRIRKNFSLERRFM